MPNYVSVQLLDLVEVPAEMPDIGDLKHRAAAVVPAGWLLCDGRAVSRGTYAALFGVIGSTWGPGDGMTTFNLPDLRARSLVGSGAGAGLSNRVLGTVGGEENHTLLLAEAPSHSHAVAPLGLATAGLAPATTSGAGPAPTPGNTSVQGTTSIVDGTVALAGTTDAGATDAVGGDGSHNTMHPWAAGYPLIYAGV